MLYNVIPEFLKPAHVSSVELYTLKDFPVDHAENPLDSYWPDNGFQVNLFSAIADQAGSEKLPST